MTRQSSALTLTDWTIFCCHPPVNDHSGMMIDMKEGHLIVLFSQDEKHLKMKCSIHELYSSSITTCTSLSCLNFTFQDYGHSLQCLGCETLWNAPDARNAGLQQTAPQYTSRMLENLPTFPVQSIHSESASEGSFRRGSNINALLHYNTTICCKKLKLCLINSSVFDRNKLGEPGQS